MNNKELNSIFKKITNWYGNKTRVLTIKSRPFNTASIFSNIINKVLKNDGKILYVLCSKNKDGICKRKQQYCNDFIEKQNRKNIESNIKFITIDLIKKIDEDFELVIFDDITFFSQVSKMNIQDAIEDMYWRSRKIIVYTIEDVFPIGNKIKVPYIINKYPIVEPRFISTRIKLEDDIPLVLYDYFKWFKKNKKKVLILIPSEDILNKVYNHYYYILKRDNIRVVKYLNEQKFRFVEDILDENDESVFIITNNIGDYIKNINDLNIVILFSNDKVYSYKKIIYLCGCLKIDEEFIPEILLVSKEISEDMDIAKNITRGFNRNLWERKLLRK